VKPDAERYPDPSLVEGMIQRWGINGTLEMLSVALCGNSDDLKPIIRFKWRLKYKNYCDPWDDGMRVPITEEV